MFCSSSLGGWSSRLGGWSPRLGGWSSRLGGWYERAGTSSSSPRGPSRGPSRLWSYPLSADTLNKTPVLFYFLLKKLRAINMCWRRYLHTARFLIHCRFSYTFLTYTFQRVGNYEMCKVQLNKKDMKFFGLFKGKTGSFCIAFLHRKRHWYSIAYSTSTLTIE